MFAVFEVSNSWNVYCITISCPIAVLTVDNEFCAVYGDQ